MHPAKTFLFTALATFLVATPLLLPVGGTAGNPATPKADGEEATAKPRLELPDGCVLTTTIFLDKEQGICLRIEGTNPGDEAVEVAAALMPLRKPDPKAEMMFRMPLPPSGHPYSCPLVLAPKKTSVQVVSVSMLLMGGSELFLTVGDKRVSVHKPKTKIEPGETKLKVVHLKPAPIEQILQDQAKQGRPVEKNES